MMLLGLHLAIFWTIFVIGANALAPDLEDDGKHIAELKRTIDFGKSRNYGTDRAIHQYWGEFDDWLAKLNKTFDALICTKPEELRTTHNEMNSSILKVEMSWHLKQEQLYELFSILHHENYTSTALAKGNDQVEDLCAGLNEYIIKANETAQDERIQIDNHLQIVVYWKARIDNEPCPCVWEEWSEWSQCSKTCQVGSTQRERSIVKEAINGGLECQGDNNQQIDCNKDVCCPVDCVWNAWEAWPNCPSGCPVDGGLQEKIRTRTKAVVAYCNGNDCDGKDFEKKPCSREEEVLEDLNTCHEEVNDLSDDLQEWQQPRSGCATLYRDVNFEGASLNLDETTEVTSVKTVGAGWNDMAKSVKVTPGCIFKGYGHKPSKPSSNPANDFILTTDLARLPDISGGPEGLSHYICECT